jgi:hypothetical protein
MSQQKAHDYLATIAKTAKAHDDAFVLIGELGRYPKSAPVQRERIEEAIHKAHLDEIRLVVLQDALRIVLKEL